MIPGIADDVLIAFGGSNTVTFNTSASINGLFVNDTLQLQDNTLTTAAGTSSTINGTLSLESATATLTGGAGSSITFDGTFDWTAGTLSGLSPTVSTTGELLMTGGGTKTFASVVLNHQSTTGTSVWTDGLLDGTFGGALNNSGLIDFSGFGSVVGTLPGTFTNSGTITVSADGPRIDTGADNTGGLIHITGGQLRHTFPWTNAGTVQVDAGTTYILDGGAFTNTGTVLSNGTIQGLAFNNDGTLAAGASPGKTVINMPLTLLSNSVVEAELGGTNQGVDYDWIEVINNAVTLGGTLNVTHFGGFTPSSNDQFLVITAANGGVSGSFATINTPAGFAYTTTVNPNDVTVEFQFVPDTFWDDGGDGFNWTDPFNWSADLVPGGADNVLIAFGGGNTVTLASGTQATNQLVTQDTLTVTGGTLDVSGNAGLDATLTLTGGVTTMTGGGSLADLDIVNGTLTVNTTLLTITDLSITGGSAVLGGNTDVTVTSAGTWSAGSMFGTGKTIVGGGAVLDINLSNAKTLDEREVENLGVINWNDGGVFVQNGPTLDNQGTFNALLSGSSRTFNFNGGALGTFTNTGTFIGNTGAAVATFDMTLNHTGATAMDIQSGTVVFNDGGTSSGDFGIQAGATVVFATAGNETHTLSGTISGAGSVGLGTAGSSGIVDLDASSVYDIGATTQIIGGTANFDGTLTDLGVRLLGTAGVANFDETNGPIVHGLDDLDIVEAQLFFNVNDVQTTNLTITGGSAVLGGNTDVTVTSAGTWSAGSMFGTGKTIVGGGAVLDINLSNAKTLDEREVENLGVINWNDGGVFVQNGPTLDNQGTFNALLSGSSRTFNFNGGALGTFTNTGTFIGNTGAAVATFDMTLNHTGATAMDIQSGTVVFNDGGTSSGDFGIQAGATVVFATAGNETHTLSGTISGAGSVGLGTAGSSGIVDLDASSVYDIGATTQIIGGTANFDGTLTDLGVRLLGTAGVANFDETNGPIVHGLDDLDIVEAQLFFNVNDVQTTNLTITGGSAVLGGDTDVTVTSAGTWSAGSMFGTGKTIVGGGAVLDINLSNAKTLDEREVENLGVINWNDGGVFVQNGPTLDNQGTFNALLSGSSRTFNFNGGAAATLNNSGTLNSNTGAAAATFDMNLTNTGTIDVQGGSLVFTGTYDQTAGITQLTGGSLFSNLQPINIDGGTLAGAGLITADVNVDNSGVLAPGLSPDITVIDGDLTLGPGSRTEIEIIGTTPGPGGHDQIQVSGNVVLDGELEVLLPNTPLFDPTPNVYLGILCGTTAGTCSGSFATITGPFGTTFNVDVNANNVELNTFVVAPVNKWIGAVDDFWNVTGNLEPRHDTAHWRGSAHRRIRGCGDDNYHH